MHIYYHYHMNEFMTTILKKIQDLVWKDQCSSHIDRWPTTIGITTVMLLLLPLSRRIVWIKIQIRIRMKGRNWRDQRQVEDEKRKADEWRERKDVFLREQPNHFIREHKEEGEEGDFTISCLLSCHTRLGTYCTYAVLCMDRQQY